uniref:Uncharacterized protein n=1 Tax=Panagrolaimus sp. PS1159 TaxID=55785 RepID=A0AC35GA17_9BILA
MTIELENIRSSSSEPEVALQLRIFIQKMKDLTKVDGSYCEPVNTKPAEATLWLAIYTLADSFTQYYRVVYSFPSTKNLLMNYAKTVTALSSIIFGFTGLVGI